MTWTPRINHSGDDPSEKIAVQGTPGNNYLVTSERKMGVAGEQEALGNGSQWGLRGRHQVLQFPVHSCLPPPPSCLTGPMHSSLCVLQNRLFTVKLHIIIPLLTILPRFPTAHRMLPNSLPSLQDLAPADFSRQISGLPPRHSFISSPFSLLIAHGQIGLLNLAYSLF